MNARLPKPKKPSLRLLTPKTLAFAVVVSFAVFLSILFLIHRAAPPAKHKPQAPVVVSPQNFSSPSASTTPARAKENVSKDTTALALEKGDARFCFTAKDPQRCFQLLMKIDPLACAQISDPILRDDCALFWAKKTNDTKYCLWASGKAKEECLEWFHTPCANITEKENKSLCLALYFNNASFCSSDACFFHYALKKKNPQACERVQLLARQVACLALISQKDLCANLSGFSRDYCYVIVAQESKHFNLCYNVESDLYKTRCFTAWAVSDNYTGACEEVPLLERWDCYTQVALKFLNPKACAAIHAYASGSRDQCFFKLALEARNPCFCNDIESYSIRDQCYGELVFSNFTFSSQLCACLPEDWAQACYRHHS